MTAPDARSSPRSRLLIALAAGVVCLMIIGALIAIMATRDDDPTRSATTGTVAVPPTVVSGAGAPATSEPATAGPTAVSSSVPVTATPGGASSTTSPNATSGPVGLGQVCTSSNLGLVLHYPTVWSTTPTCTAFDPAPITVPQNSELPVVAVYVTALESDWASARDALLHTPQAFGTTEQVEETTLGGWDAVCLVSIADGLGQLPADSRSFMCGVDVDGHPVMFVAATLPGASSGGHDTVMRAMVAAATAA